MEDKDVMDIALTVTRSLCLLAASTYASRIVMTKEDVQRLAAEFHDYALTGKRPVEPRRF